MRHTPYYESDNPSTVIRGASWRTAVWIICAVVFFGFLAAGIWVFKVVTSDTKGRGDAVRTKNSSGNRIAAQERFEQLMAEVKAADQKVAVFADQLETNPGDPTLRTQYTGARTYCIQQREDYNANARKYTQADFRAIDLPDQIDATDPATDCK